MTYRLQINSLNQWGRTVQRQMLTAVLMSAPVCLPQSVLAFEAEPSSSRTVTTIQQVSTANGVEVRVESRKSFTRIRVPGSITQKSREMILDFATPKTRKLILGYEQEIDLLNKKGKLDEQQKRRRNALVRTRFKLMREIVTSHPNLHSDIRRMANGHRYRQGVLLAYKIMKNPKTYQQVLSNADPEMATAIRRNNDSLRKISTMIKRESANNHTTCNAHRMDALYQKMSSILDNQVGALERSGFVNTSFAK